MRKTLTLDKKMLLLFVFIIPFVFVTKSYAAPIVFHRALPKTHKITLPNDIGPENPCPEILPGHISICGYLSTIDVHKRKGVEYVQEPIKGATVAAYLGPGRWKYLSKFPDNNKTAEIVGKIEGLYMYDISNADGKFIVAVPKGSGTDGFAYIGFFCENTLKDVYMIDTSQSFEFMPISISCTKTVKPSTINSIPAPPSITYLDRNSYLGCERAKTTWGTGGMQYDAANNIRINLLAEELDDTHLGAQVNQQMCADSATLVYDVNGVPSCELTNDHPCGDPVFLTPSPAWRDIPEHNSVQSRRDLEGYTHSSLGYSQQALSSMNCGMAGCYNVSSPVKFGNEVLYLNKDMVRKCNTEWPMPLNCYGPGIEAAVPGWYEESYWFDHQRHVEIYQPFIDPIFGIHIGGTLGGIILPGHRDRWFHESSIYFPYSTVLNYMINKILANTFENRPVNDSYENIGGGVFNYCASGEQPRLLPPVGIIKAALPFKACYGAVMLGDDTYSVQKSLFMFTRNTDPQINGDIKQDPPVANFYGPMEEIGVERSPKADARPNGIENIQKVGKGYWRLGVANTFCTLGTPDMMVSRLYPILAIVGDEGKLNARPLP